MPHTKVQTLGAAISCDSDVSEPVSLELQLGVKCRESFVFDDYLFECGDGGMLLDGRGGNTSCGIDSTVPVSTTPADIGFATVSVETDYRWGLVGYDRCLGPTESPTTSPTVNPITAQLSRYTPAQLSRTNPDLWP